MKKYQIIVAALSGILLMASCGKSKHFPSRPDLTYTSIYPKDVSVADSFAITCSFKDKEGDIQDSIFYQAINVTTPLPTLPPFAGYQVPRFPAQKNMEGNIIVILKPGIDFTGPNGTAAQDSFYFKIFLRDLAGHISDTISTDTILVHGT